MNRSFLINAQKADHSEAKRGSTFPTILGLAAVIFALDQATKFLVLQNIARGQSWSFFPAIARVFKLTFITNTGAAFGIFPQLGGIFMVIAVVVIIAILAFNHHLPTEYVWVRVSLGLQLGGAMGNLLDRFVHGFVVDFVDIGFWPIFNLADLSIVLGVCILAYHLWNEDNYVNTVEKMPPLPEGEKL